MTVLNNYGRIILVNLIIIIFKLIYAEAYYLENIGQKLNNNDFNSNINDSKKFKLINRGQFLDYEKRDDDDDIFPLPRDGYLVVMITSYLVVYLNFVGTSYVLYRSFYRWKNTRNTLPMTLRVPMYIAMTDSLFMITHLINISHTATTQTPWVGMSCKIIGGFAFFFQCMNIFLVGGVAITTFLRVKRGRCFSLGKYDYKLFTGMFILSLISTTAFSGNFGANKYWCAGDYEDINLAIFSLVIISLVTTVSLFCYISIIKELRSLEVNEYFANGNLPEEIANQRKETNKRIYSKISSYILIFIIQYIPVTIYNVGHILQVDHYWIFVVCDFGLNFGGIGNFVQYTINEGWSDKPDESDNAYNLNFTNYRIPHANRGTPSNHNNNIRRSINNQDFSEAIDSFGIIRPSTASTARQKQNKKIVRPITRFIP